ncbi:MAG: hypothetical protein EPO08_17830 [Rhodospirillaceae bacterium]|nr:MAG: hypothetical protein EPO08_17830 [Rhodospirillaceae bacterium]
MVELSRYGEVVFHHANDRGRVTTDPNDILLGHPPYPDLKEYDNWIFDNGLDGPRSAHPNTFIMFPYARADFTVWPSVPLPTYVKASRAFFGMGGVVHYDGSLETAPAESIWRQIQPKFVRVNMGCDTRRLPYKIDFKHRPSGLLHVSSLAKYKKPDLMFRSLPKTGCRLYLGTFAVSKLDEFWRQKLLPADMQILPALDNGDPGTNARLIQECSFYLHTAAEPQATTILENCARGLVPILHPDSGFRSPYAIYLTDDPTENQGIIAAALAMKEDEYAERSLGVRRQIQIYHSWQRIFMNIFADMQALVAGGEVNRRGDEFS